MTWSWADIYDDYGNETPEFQRAMQNVEDEIEEEERRRAAQKMEAGYTAATA